MPNDQIPLEELDSGIIIKAFLAVVIAALFAVGLWVFFGGVDIWMADRWGL